MKRWAMAFGIVSFLAILIVAFHSRATGLLLNDTDTRVMLTRIEQRGDPWSWFVGDWPLLNHFYRPLVALVFEADLKLYGWNPHGFAITNALLCAGCVLALFWLLRELFDSPRVAGLGASLYALWHLWPWVQGALAQVGWVLTALGLGALLWGVFGRKKGEPLHWKPGVLVLALAHVLPIELACIYPFRSGMIDWIPGRTASTMGLFCFLAMAAYARYERLSSQRRPLPDPGPLDPPATRSTVLQAVQRSPVVILLAVGAVILVWMALASYEQAVMLPAALFGVALTLWIRGHRVRWAWQIPFWGMIGVYWAMRRAFLPSTISQYQDQQFRTGFDVYLTLADYAFPAARQIKQIANTWDLGPISLVINWNLWWSVLAYALVFGLAIQTIYKGLRSRDRELALLLLGGWALSLVTFLPMAWLKPFSYNHYHYWPLAFRTLFVLGLVGLTWRQLSLAMSRPALQAPPRPSPAPGSLPRP